jgi:hypothetical protein
MPLDEAGSRGRLAHLMPLFWEAVVCGVQDYYEKYQDTAHVHRSTTMRSIMRDHIVDRLRLLLDDRADVKVSDRNQTTYFGCCAQFRILVKKSDEEGLVELPKTQASFDFQCNEGQYVLNPDVIPDITNLYLSYVPNDDDPTQPSVFLICPCEEGWLWRIEIEPPVSDVVPVSAPDKRSPGSDEIDLVRLPAKKQPDAE